MFNEPVSNNSNWGGGSIRSGIQNVRDGFVKSLTDAKSNQKGFDILMFFENAT